jgi:hypothetical protein
LNGIITASGSSATPVIYIGSTSATALSFTGYFVSNSGYGITNAGSGTATINANYTITGTASQFIIDNTSTGIVNFNGNITGATTSTAYAIRNNSTGQVTITGNIIAGSVSPSSTLGIVQNVSTGTITITGNIQGGSVANTIAVNNASTGTLNITGTTTGGGNATNSPAIYTATTGVIDITGACISGTYPAIYTTSASNVLRIRGNITYTNGIVPFYAFNVFCDPSAVQTITMRTTSSSDRLFSTSNISNGAPAIANVRAGVVYGSSSEFTGTLVVPSPSNVRKGVSTDNTTGTAELTASDFWDALTSSFSTSGSIGKLLKDNIDAKISEVKTNVISELNTSSVDVAVRLRNVSTIQSTGDQIASQ